MTYQAVVDMANSASLQSRITACAVDEGLPNEMGTMPGEPQSWTRQHIWEIASAPGWSEAWDYAKGTASVNANPDTGTRDDVITDAMILAVVQPMVQEILNPA